MHLDSHFQYTRSLTWSALLARMLKGAVLQQRYASAGAMVLAGMASWLPALAQVWLSADPQKQVNLRPALVLAANITQVALGCRLHRLSQPEPALAAWVAPPAWRAAILLLSNSGVVWLNMCGLIGALPFRFAILQQAVLTIMLLLTSTDICTRGVSLQGGFVVLQSAVTRLARRVLPSSLAGLVAVLPSGAAPTSQQALTTCLAYQPAVLLALGFVAPTLFIYWREMAARQAFIHDLARKQGGTPVRLHPPPSLLNYWAFAVPAIGLMYSYVIL